MAAFFLAAVANVDGAIAGLIISWIVHRRVGD